MWLASILFLGTGNDLSRVTKWGSVYREPCFDKCKQNKLEQILDTLIHSDKVKLDR